MPNVRIERQDAVASLVIDKPRGNAIDTPLLDDLIEATGELAADDGVRAVLLGSGHPRIFCPGLDLVELIDYDRSAMEHVMMRFDAAVRALCGFPKPLVAAISGHALAGGCILALTADWRLLSSGGVKVGLNEIRVGVPLPWSVTVLVRGVLPANHVTRVALLGNNLEGAAAREVGLVDEVVAPESFAAAAHARVAGFAERLPIPWRVTKTFLRRPQLAEMRAGEAASRDAFLDCWFSEATQARLREAAQTLTARGQTP